MSLHNHLIIIGKISSSILNYRFIFCINRGASFQHLINLYFLISRNLNKYFSHMIDRYFPNEVIRAVLCCTPNLRLINKINESDRTTDSEAKYLLKLYATFFICTKSIKHLPPHVYAFTCIYICIFENKHWYIHEDKWKLSESLKSNEFQENLWDRSIKFLNLNIRLASINNSWKSMEINGNQWK